MLICPETAHDIALSALYLSGYFNPALRFLNDRYSIKDERLSRKIFNIEFPNPIGLAAGFDKNAHALPALASMGFGFIEAGTVTLWPEPGNPKPRIFKGYGGKWILNRVGFANHGSQKISRNLFSYHSKFSPLMPIGISLGKMRTSPAERLSVEVRQMLRLFYPSASFFAINVSCPNVKDRSGLNKVGLIKHTLQEIINENASVAAHANTHKRPVLVKVGPILSQYETDSLSAAFEEACVDGIIATNTMPVCHGGLSGLPLRELALKTLKRFYQRLNGRIPLIGVGGILSPEDAWQRISCGASLVELYSGFIFRGPHVIRETCRYLLDRMDKKGFKNIKEACGIDAQQD
ncbi:quinone-dependent dihydroorotate dehydrogenase [Elusimicrobiota bacterium]